MTPWQANLLWKFWYPLLTRRMRNSPVVFLNYGYADDAPETKQPALLEKDEPDRVCLQLYDRVVQPVDLHGLTVLEVSCGHGGGAAYMARYLKPKSMHGIDRNARAIALCKQIHPMDGLTFSCGNALALDFPDGDFDAVVNVEASHCYPDIPRFFHEVYRVLRPGGHFLYADFRDVPDRALLQKQLAESGLEMVYCADISSNVLLGMQRNTQRYMKLIRQLVPRPLRKLAMRFAGVPGSAIYCIGLQSGETVYLCYHLRKPA